MKKIKLMEVIVASIIALASLGIIVTALINPKKEVKMPSPSDAMLKDITSINKDIKNAVGVAYNENKSNKEGGKGANETGALNSPNQSKDTEEAIDPLPPIENSTQSSQEKNSNSNVTTNKPNTPAHEKDKKSTNEVVSQTEEPTAVVPLPPASTPLAYGGWLSGRFANWVYQTPSVGKPVSDTLGY
jgi:hypothetical protein